MYLPRGLPPKGLQIADNNPAIGRQRRKRLRRTAVRYTDVGGSSGAFSIYAWAHNPSPRLRWTVTAAFELASGADFVAGATAPTWTATAMRRNPDSGRTASMNSIFSARALPDGYELDSGVKDVRIVLAVNSANLPTGVEGELVLEATWEPNGFLDDEIDRLLSIADISVATTNGQPLNLNT